MRTERSVSEAAAVAKAPPDVQEPRVWGDTDRMIDHGRARHARVHYESVVAEAAREALVVAYDAGEPTEDLVAQALDAGVTLAEVQRACWHETGSL